MINKKLVGTALVGLITVGLSGQVLAAENYDTKDVVKSESAEMEVRGTLGVMDNTNPGEDIPEGSIDWINVTIPTAVIFNAREDQTIDSPDYKIKNNSGRGVEVMVNSYEIQSVGDSLAALTELNMLSQDGKVVGLAKEGVSVATAPQELATISAGTTEEFKLTGNVDKTKLTEEKFNVASKVTFGFRAIPKL